MRQSVLRDHAPPIPSFFVLVSHSFLGDMKQRPVLSCALQKTKLKPVYTSDMSHSFLPSLYSQKCLYWTFRSSCNKLSCTSLVGIILMELPRNTHTAIAQPRIRKFRSVFRECVVRSTSLHSGGRGFESWHWVNLSLRQILGFYINALKASGLYGTGFNLLKPKTYFMFHQLQHSEIVCCAHSAFMCFVWISEQTAIISLCSINLSVFKTEAESVYCAVRTGSLNATDTVSHLKG